MESLISGTLGSVSLIKELNQALNNGATDALGNTIRLRQVQQRRLGLDTVVGKEVAELKRGELATMVGAKSQHALAQLALSRCFGNAGSDEGVTLAGEGFDPEHA